MPIHDLNEEHLSDIYKDILQYDLDAQKTIELKLFFQLIVEFRDLNRRLADGIESHDTEAEKEAKINAKELTKYKKEYSDLVSGIVKLNDAFNHAEEDADTMHGNNSPVYLEIVALHKLLRSTFNFAFLQSNENKATNGAGQP